GECKELEGGAYQGDLEELKGKNQGVATRDFKQEADRKDHDCCRDGFDDVGRRRSMVVTWILSLACYPLDRMPGVLLARSVRGGRHSLAAMDASAGRR
ncbi:hypothetical protein ACLOJK_023128, partial [Asimina triloba]